MLGSLFRRILPYLKSVAPIALRTGANIVEDVSKRKTWIDATFDRVPETISRVAFGGRNQSGSGYRRKRKRQKTHKQKVKRVKRDIFS